MVFFHPQTSRKLGFPVLYGDGSRPAVLQSAGISSPKAVMVMFTEKKATIEAVQKLRLAFPAVRTHTLFIFGLILNITKLLWPQIPIYARAKDVVHLLDLKNAGATDAILEDAEVSVSSDQDMKLSYCSCRHFWIPSTYNSAICLCRLVYNSGQSFWKGSASCLIKCLFSVGWFWTPWKYKLKMHLTNPMSKSWRLWNRCRFVYLNEMKVMFLVNKKKERKGRSTPYKGVETSP